MGDSRKEFLRVPSYCNALGDGQKLKRRRTPRTRSLFLISAWIGQCFQAAAGEDFLKFMEQRVMHQPVRGQRLAAVQLKRRAVKTADVASGFFHNQNARRCVPRIEIELPKAIEATTGDVAQVERGRTGAANSVRAQRDLVVEVNVGILVAFVAGKSGRDQALFQLRGLRDADGLPVQVRAFSLLRGK